MIDNHEVERKTALQALDMLRGDDLWRARMAFKGKSKSEMDQQWGQSGRTCAEILADYEAHEARVNSAIHWVKNAR